MEGFCSDLGNRGRRQYYNCAHDTCAINANRIHDNEHGDDRKENARADAGFCFIYAPFTTPAS